MSSSGLRLGAPSGLPTCAGAASFRGAGPGWSMEPLTLLPLRDAAGVAAGVFSV